MRRRRRPIRLFSFSFVDILATTIGVLVFILLMAVLNQSGLVEYSQWTRKLEAAEAELEVLRAKAAATEQGEEEVYDFHANEKEYMELMLDGDVDGALVKREEIDAAKEAKWLANSTHKTKTDITESQSQEELIALTTEAEQMFDVFNPDSDDYDQAVLDKVIVFMKGYENSGLPRPDAFVTGLADVVELYGLTYEGQETAEPDTTKKPTGKPKVDPKKKGLAEKAHKPTVTDGGGANDTGVAAPDIENMTDEELDALPEKALARLRGDFL